MNKTTMRWLRRMAVPLLAMIVAGCSLQAPASPEVAATEFVFPTATEVPSSGSITGRVWHDLCASGTEGEPSPETPPSGCVRVEGGGFEADGILAAEEPGIASVTVRLGEGGCPAFGLAEATTDEAGAYRFDGLQAGTYCLSVDASGEPNSSVLIPGGWTFPASEDGGPAAQQTITLEDAGVVDGVNFGWDHQFLPEVTPEPGVTATATPEPTATVTSTPAATIDPDDPTAGLGQPLSNDELDTAGNWQLYENDQVAFTHADGRMEMRALKADFTFWWTLTSPSVEDFFVEGVVGWGEECAGRDQTGLVVRSSEVNDEWVGYLFGITCDGRYQLRIWDGEAVTSVVPLTSSEFLTAGPDQEYRLGLRAEGDSFSLYVDGDLLTEVTDDTYEAGQAGVYVSAAITPGFEAYLDRITVWELP